MAAFHSPESLLDDLGFRVKGDILTHGFLQVSIRQE